MENIFELDATGTAQAIASGRVTASQVMDSVIDRIAEENPAFNAIVTFDPGRCRALALDADKAVERGDALGPLHGVPVTVKDNFAVGGMPATAGSKRLAGNMPESDAAVVARLQAAGAIVIGKTNLPEMASDLQTDNALFGRTANPWNTDFTPGGSSGGEAAAVASGMSFLGLGNDLLVSVRLPAHYCGLFSYLPTAGLLPMSGFIPSRRPAGLLKHILRPGFLARSPRDLGVAIRATAGPVPQEPWMIPADLLLRGSEEVSPSIDSIRCAVCTVAGDIPASAETIDTIREFTAGLSHGGATIIEYENAIYDHDAASRTWMGLFRQEMGSMLPPAVRFSAGLFSKGLNPSLGEYHRLEAGRNSIITQVDEVFSDADILITPVSSTPAFRHMQPIKVRGPMRKYPPLEIDGKPYPYAAVTSAFGFCFALTGHPVATVPAGLSSEGLPIGIQIIGRRWDDRWFLRALEVLCAGRIAFRPPKA